MPSMKENIESQIAQKRAAKQAAEVWNIASLERKRIEASKIQEKISSCENIIKQSDIVPTLQELNRHFLGGKGRVTISSGDWPCTIMLDRGTESARVEIVHSHHPRAWVTLSWIVRIPKDPTRPRWMIDKPNSRLNHLQIIVASRNKAEAAVFASFRREEGSDININKIGVPEDFLPLNGCPSVKSAVATVKFNDVSAVSSLVEKLEPELTQRFVDLVG